MCIELFCCVWNVLGMLVFSSFGVLKWPVWMDLVWVRCTSHAWWLVVGAFYHGKVVGSFIEDYAGY